jgi:NAD(P)-dependent dehydrogenase (short-subunit alcohol dehydrogenase family)
MKKTVFITGASSGLGKACARLFQKNGWNVIATMRNPERETELNQLANVTLLPLDVTKPEQVKEIVEKLLVTYPVDVVLNNAGYGLIGPLEALTDEQINLQIQTNLLGVINVAKALVPHLRERRSGVIINVTSSFGLLSYPTCSVYSATKFAIDGFSEGLGHELAQFKVRVKVVAPGGMQTDFTGRSMQGGSHEAYQQLVAKVSEGYSDAEVANYTKAEDVAQIIFEAASDDKDQFRYIAGKDAIALFKERINLGPEEQVRQIKAQFVF